MAGGAETTEAAGATAQDAVRTDANENRRDVVDAVPEERRNGPP